MSSFETLKDTYNDKYEYILPEIFLDKNLVSSEKYGNIDLTSSFNCLLYTSDAADE